MRTFPRVRNPGPGLPGYELARHIVTPTLYITRRHDDAPLEVPAHVELAEVRFPDPLPMAADGWRAGVGALVKLGAYATFYAASLRRMTRWRPDVIHAHSLPALLHGVLGSRRLGVPWVFSFHGSELRRATRPPLRGLIARADGLFYVSRHMEPTIAAAFPDVPRWYTPSGVDLATFTPGPPEDREPLIITVGRFAWQKGLEHLVDALPAVRARAPALRVIMVGRGPAEPEIRARARARGVEEHITIVPHLGRAEVSALMRRAFVMALPSVSEGFPKVVLEAMASGLPVVSADVGCCAEVLGPAGVVVPPARPDVLAGALLELWADPERRARMGDAGVRRAAGYTWEATASVALEAFRAVTDRDASRRGARATG